MRRSSHRCQGSNRANILGGDQDIDLFEKPL